MMSSAIAVNSTTDLKPARLWTGRVLTAIPILMLTLSASMKLSHSAKFVEQWTGKFGFPESQLTGVGILELIVMLTYAIPKTRFIGAVLVAAYLGGATVTHLRVGDPFIIPPILGIFAWVGFYLTEPRLSALTPLRTPR